MILVVGFSYLAFSYYYYIDLYLSIPRWLSIFIMKGYWILSMVFFSASIDHINVPFMSLLWCNTLIFLCWTILAVQRLNLTWSHLVHESFNVMCIMFFSILLNIFFIYAHQQYWPIISLSCLFSAFGIRFLIIHFSRWQLKFNWTQKFYTFTSPTYTFYAVDVTHYLF